MHVFGVGLEGGDSVIAIAHVENGYVVSVPEPRESPKVPEDFDPESPHAALSALSALAPPGLRGPCPRKTHVFASLEEVLQFLRMELGAR